jgi:hypothetical protein
MLTLATLQISAEGKAQSTGHWYVKTKQIRELLQSLNFLVAILAATVYRSEGQAMKPLQMFIMANSVKMTPSLAYDVHTFKLFKTKYALYASWFFRNLL